MLDNLLGRGLDHVVVGLKQIIAAHPRLARKARGDHHQVRIRRVGVVIGAFDSDVVAFDGTGLEQVQPFALRNTLKNIYEDDISELSVCKPMGQRRAHIS